MGVFCSGKKSIKPRLHLNRPFQQLVQEFSNGIRDIVDGSRVLRRNKSILDIGLA